MPKKTWDKYSHPGTTGSNDRCNSDYNDRIHLLGVANADSDADPDPGSNGGYDTSARCRYQSNKYRPQCLPGIDVSDTQGYGCFTDQGRGYFPSWSDHLHVIAREKADNDYFGKWYPLFDETFLERDLYQDLYRRMCDLLVYCPEDRFLIFGGLSLHAMLAQDGNVTAVLNWVDASYGDVVYDIAVLDFWWPWLGMHNAFQKDAQQRGHELPFYAERLLCYECHHALGALRFFAKSGVVNERDWKR